jgi:hypothetical protein
MPQMPAPIGSLSTLSQIDEQGSQQLAPHVLRMRHAELCCMCWLRLLGFKASRALQCCARRCSVYGFFNFIVPPARLGSCTSCTSRQAGLAAIAYCR